jgi:TetR/AcrR family transcriptional regulator, transcriptional repressor for nem operon
MIAIICCAMRHSRDEKAKSHDRIVGIASARIRTDGTDAPGVAEIMKAAGLTHGGFYKHFGSRDELIAEAAEHSFNDSQRHMVEATDGADEPLAALVDSYLSAEHRDNPASGCGVVALGADAPRAGDRVRAAYTDQVRNYLAELERLIGGPDDDDAETRKRAVVTLTTLVGSLLVARAVDDPALSDEILRDVRTTLWDP